MRLATLCLLAFSLPLAAQDPTAAVEGEVVDQTGAPIPAASIVLKNSRTGATLTHATPETGLFQFPVLPVGLYEISIEKPSFITYRNPSIQLNVNQTIRLHVTLNLEGAHDTVTVQESAALVQTSANVLGNVVTHREVAGLPLNGRNFSQLGQLQLGVAPMTAGLTEQGGSRRSGHAYIVNGQRPESNNFLLDGARVVNRIDGGFALKPPIDAIDEFKILTHTAPAEYGGASGANTSVVTRSGGNDVHGVAYEFLRNDRLDTRNFFVPQTEPLKQNQFGGTLGGPIRRNRSFFHGYFEGFRNRQGITRGSTVPTPAQRSGDFTAAAAPVKDANGNPFPGGIIPRSLQDSLAVRLLDYYPLGNVTPSFRSSTEPLANDTEQAGVKFDFQLAQSDSLSTRYTFSQGITINPFSILGADLPGFPVQDDLRTQLFSVAHTHSSGSTINTFRASFFRHWFLLERRLSGLSPRALGFNFDSTLTFAQGSPFVIVNGYSNMGDPAIGPRDTTQNDFEFQESLARASGRHSYKFGIGYRRTQVNSNQGHYANGAYIFSNSPATDPFANFLMGRPSTFTQAGGDFYRGLRSRDFNAYGQDEWRVSQSLTLNYGLRYEITTPFNEINGRLNAFAPGRRSSVFSRAPAGVLVPGDPGVPAGIAPVYYGGFMPRVGVAWDPSGGAQTAIRAGYAVFYDTMANGVGGPLRVATQTLPWVVVRQAAGNAVNFAQPFSGAPPSFAPGVFTQPINLFTISSDLRPPYAQNWNLAVQRNWGGQTVELRYVGTKGTHLPRFIEANPAVHQPGATAANAGRRRVYANCPDATGPCDLGYAALVDGSTNSTYHAAQASLARRFQKGAGFNVSYTFSKTLDYSSSLHIAGPAPILVSGEMDLAQNPFDLRAEHGLSLFDAKHRLVASGIWQPGWFHHSSRRIRRMFDQWEFSTIAVVSTGTPFTVYDSRNVSLQAAIPPVAGTFASRPDAVSDPNGFSGRSVEQWVSASSFRRLDAVTEAGRFGNAGRNIVRGPGKVNIDLSLSRTFAVMERLSLQFRAEAFNAMNHANLGIPVNDLVSPNFGHIVEAGPPRLLQFALKLIW